MLENKNDAVIDQVIKYKDTVENVEAELINYSIFRSRTSNESSTKGQNVNVNKLTEEELSQEREQKGNITKKNIFTRDYWLCAEVAQYYFRRIR